MSETIHQCDNCKTTYTASEIPVPLEDFWKPELLGRLEPGGTVPSGECDCGALVYPVAGEAKTETHPDQSHYHARQVGKMFQLHTPDFNDPEGPGVNHGLSSQTAHRLAGELCFPLSLDIFKDELLNEAMEALDRIARFERLQGSFCYDQAAAILRKVGRL